MPTLVLLLFIAALLPLAGFGIVLSLGRRMGFPLAGWAGASTSLASFGCTLTAMLGWYGGSRGAENWGFAVRPIFRSAPWISLGSLHPITLDVGLYVDSLTVATFAMITLVSAIVCVYAIGYFRHAENAHVFFAWAGFGEFAILGFVLSGTLLQMAVFWALIGLGFYLLAGNRFELPGTGRSIERGFIIQRIGDAAFLMGLCMLISKIGLTALPNLWAALGDAAGGHAVLLPGGAELSVASLTFIGLLLFGAAAVRCAQFPLHIWLSGSADASPPALAMIGGIATAPAGIYLLARLFPLLTPDVRLVVAIVGVVTLSLATLLSLVQRDLPRFLAWLAVAQLGWMVLGVGVGSWVGALFQLIAVAFIFAVLCLAAGSAINANSGQRAMKQLAGGWREMPITASVFALGVFAMAGTPLFSKYYSQSILVSDSAAFAILASAGGRAWGNWLFYLLPTAMTYVLAFSLGRCWVLTFDRPRAAGDEPHLRERASLLGPAIALVIPAIVAGYAMNVPELIQRSMVETTALCDDLRPHADNPANRFNAFDQTWPVAQPALAGTGSADDLEPSAPQPSRTSEALERGRQLHRRWALWSWLIGLGFAVAFYWKGDDLAAVLIRRPPVHWIYRWLDREMYIAELYDWMVARPFAALARMISRLDRHLIARFDAGATK